MARLEFTQEVADLICERLANGESLRWICKDAALPGLTTVMKWLLQNESFVKQYARAREIQADVLAEEIVDISNTPQEGVKTIIKTTGIEEHRGDMIEHRRLQVDARKWYASKLAPKKYGDRMTHAGDAENPVFVEGADARAIFLGRLGAQPAAGSDPGASGEPQ